MAPKLLAYVDKKGRPIPVVVISLLFGCLAFINLDRSGGGNIFNWLLALAGLSTLFVFGSIALAHIRFRLAWYDVSFSMLRLFADSEPRKHNGHSLDELPFRAFFGVWGSYVCIFVNFIALVAQFYVALYPVGGPYLVAETFVQDYLAGFILLGLYIIWKVYSWFVYPSHRRMWIAIKDIDIYTGMRRDQAELVSGPGVNEEQSRRSIAEFQEARHKQGLKGWAVSIFRSIF